MHKDLEHMTRREFIDHAAKVGAGVTAIAAGATNVAGDEARNSASSVQSRRKTNLLEPDLGRHCLRYGAV